MQTLLLTSITIGLETEQTLDRNWLYELGFWNALSHVLSPGAMAKIRETGTFYHILPENPSASEWSIFWLRLFRTDANLFTIREGVNLLVDRLHDELIERDVKIFLNSTVDRIGPVDDQNSSRIFVGVVNEDIVEFDNVILALPAKPLRALEAPFSFDVQKKIESVIPFPLLKIFVVLDEPLWEV